MQSIRSTIKFALSVLALLFAFGVVGSMDYHDAVMLENAQQHLDLQDCPKTDSRWATQTSRRALPDAKEVSPAAPCQVPTQ